MCDADTSILHYIRPKLYKPYCLDIQEEKRNYYSLMADNPEVVRIVSLLRTIAEGPLAKVYIISFRYFSVHLTDFFVTSSSLNVCITLRTLKMRCQDSDATFICGKRIVKLNLKVSWKAILIFQSLRQNSLVFMKRETRLEKNQRFLTSED